MRDFLENLLYFKKIHPIRFWGLIIVAIIICCLLFILIRFLSRQRAIRQNRSNVVISNNDIDSDIVPSRSVLEKEKDFILESKEFKYVDFLIFGVLIASIVAALIYNSSKVHENISISNSKYVFGIDISHYQGRINWSEVRTSHHPIEYVFIRATMGADGVDTEFKNNWLKSKKEGYIRGVYHYYRPNENSKEQFDNFAATVSLEKGDFPPILDVENHSKFGHENLRTGVLNWLELAEAEYGIKPIVYTGRTFYNNILKGHVDDYPLWIASYSDKHKLNDINWTFHQFTEKVIVKGIKTSVDGNDFVADIEDLKNMCLK